MNTNAIAKNQPSFAERVVQATLAQGQFEKLLPAQLRPMAERFLSTAKLYIATCNHREKLAKCTVASIVTCILNAAKFGLLLDGKQAHAVPFNTKVKGDGGKETWESQAQFIPDYKGLVGAIRRLKIVADAEAHHVYENDTFYRRMKNGKWDMEYEPALSNRGEYLGTFATLLLHDGRCLVTYMDYEEIEAIRQRSKSKDDGPWVTDTGEMRKKTVIKRALKLYADDPEVSELMTLDNEADGITLEQPPEKPRGIRQAEPLRLNETINAVDFTQAIEKPEPIPVKAKPEQKQEAKERTIAEEFISMFAHCKTVAQCEETRQELMGSDPTLEMATDFERAYKQKVKEVS